MVISSSKSLPLFSPLLLVHLNSRVMIFLGGGAVSLFLSVFLFLLLDSLFQGRSIFSVSSALHLNCMSLGRWQIQLCLLGMMKTVNLWQAELDLRMT